MTAEIGKKCIAVPNRSGGYNYADGYVPSVGERIMAYPRPEGGYFVMPVPSLQVGDTIQGLPTSGPIIPTRLLTWDDITRYYLSAVVSSSGVSNSTNCLGNTSSYASIAAGGFIEASFGYNIEDSSKVVVTEWTVDLYEVALDPNDYIYPEKYAWSFYADGHIESAKISFKLPNIIRVECDVAGFELASAMIYAFKMLSE